jgi:putative aldouronate transport system permease protein
MSRFWPYYVLVLPGIVYFIAFKYIPLLGIAIAFQDYSVFKGFLASPWVGFKHFGILLQYPDFLRVFSNTLILGAYKTVFTFPIPVVFALMMNEIGNKYLKRSIQTAVYIPYFLSWVIVAGLIFDLFGMGGMFNNLRALFGMDPVLVMQKESYFRVVYVFSSIWKEAGWGTVIYMAAISGIDPALYESAIIDGASKMRQIRHITFPLLIPTILTLFLLNIGNFLDLGFDQVYNLLTPMTFSVGDIFDTYVYRNGIQQAQYSFTTAVGLFQSTIGFILVFAFNKIANKFSDGGLW